MCIKIDRMFIIVLIIIIWYVIISQIITNYNLFHWTNNKNNKNTVNYNKNISIHHIINNNNSNMNMANNSIKINNININNRNNINNINNFKTNNNTILININLIKIIWINKMIKIYHIHRLIIMEKLIVCMIEWTSEWNDK